MQATLHCSLHTYVAVLCRKKRVRNLSEWCGVNYTIAMTAVHSADWPLWTRAMYVCVCAVVEISTANSEWQHNDFIALNRFIVGEEAWHGLT